MDNLEKCPICGSELLARRPDAGTSPRVTDENGTVWARLVYYTQCMACGITFQNPRMNKEELHEYYASGVYRAELNQTQENLDGDEERRAQFISNTIRNSPSLEAPESHLDVGCSRGYLLRDVGAYKKVGVDLNSDYLTEEIDQHCTSLDDVKGKFDLITLVHGLEHELDPVDTLKKCVRHLKKDGTILVEVPSKSSPGGPMRLAHTYVFEPWTLIDVAHRAGLEAVGVALTPHILITFKRS